MHGALFFFACHSRFTLFLCALYAGSAIRSDRFSLMRALTSGFRSRSRLTLLSCSLLVWSARRSARASESQ